MRFCIRKKFFVCLNCEGIADCPFAGETEDADNTQFFPSTAAAGRSVVERGATSPNLPGDRSRRAGLTSALGSVGRQRVVGHYLGAGSASAFSGEVDTGSREENASKQESRAPFRFSRNGKGSSAQAHARPRRFLSACLARQGIGDVAADSSNKIGSRRSPHKRGITDSDGLD
jgi:hypothetical protein